MSSSINGQLNQASLGSSNALNAQLKELAKTRRQLSTGQAVQTAADGPGILSKDVRLATKMRSAIKARLNINQSISLGQTAEARLSSLMNPLQRLKEMGIQAMNETYSDEDRRYMQLEADSIVQGLQETVAQSTFNGHSLLNGDFQAQVTMNGTSGAEKTSLSLQPFRFEDTTLTYAGDQDIVFLIDATGSMQNAINDLAAGIRDFASSFLEDVSGGEVRINVIAYTNTLRAQAPVGLDFEEVGFQTITKENELNQTGVDTIANYLDQLTAGGGDEDIDDVFSHVKNNLFFRENSQKHVVLIGSVGDEYTGATANDPAVGNRAVDYAKELIAEQKDLKLHTVAVDSSALNFSGSGVSSSYFREDLGELSEDGHYLEFPSGGGIASQLKKIMVTEVDGVDFSSHYQAVRSTAWIDHFIKKVDQERSKVGGYLAGLEQKLRFNESEEVIQEGVRGRLSSADFGELSTKISKNTLLVNSHATMRSEMIRTYGVSLLSMIDSWGIA